MQAPFLHRALCITGDAMASSFYAEIYQYPHESIVPKTGPVVITCTHANQLLDICILSRRFPWKRMHRYWAKASLFKNAVFRYILLNSGNIPVDRRNNDNQVLLRGSFEILDLGEVLSLFPEGTSYTEPRIMQVKDGAAWAILEYAKWRTTRGKLIKPPPLVIPVSIVYTDKQHYRSAAVMRYGNPMDVADLEDEFLSCDEAGKRQAVKKLSARIEQNIVELSINAPDWDTLHAATIARQLLWGDDRKIPLVDFVSISQTLVDLFSTADLPDGVTLRSQLIAYYALLETTQTTHAVLNSLLKSTDVPTRWRATIVLASASASSALRFPFFVVPFIVHAPVYALASWGGKLAQDEIEARAQAKIALAAIGQIIVYPLLTGLLWSRVSLGGLRSVVITAFISFLHSKLVDTNYWHLKRLVTAWRLLRGLCSSPSSELSESQLKPFLSPFVPPPNPFLQKVQPPPTDGPPAAKRPPKPPSRRLIRHLLRSRSNAATALSNLFLKLPDSSGTPFPLRASPHLARVYGSPGASVEPVMSATSDGVATAALSTAWRDSNEVVEFLRQRGANIAPRTA